MKANTSAGIPKKAAGNHKKVKNLNIPSNVSLGRYSILIKVILNKNKDHTHAHKTATSGV